MPLTIRALKRADFMPLIEKIEKRLQGWQTKLISRGGRLQLVQSVMSTILIYHMLCFILLMWVIHRIDKARRAFLWGKSGSQQRGISLCNWELVCTDKCWGGLRLPDLRLRNISLALRWWWKSYTDQTSMWTSLVVQIRW